MNDLIGRTVTIDGDEWTVDSTAPWSDGYVYLARVGDDAKADATIVRPAAVVRRALELRAAKR